MQSIEPEVSTRVVLIRHGETEWSRSGRHTGRTDVALTDRGTLQAEHVGGLMQTWNFELVLTSPLIRAAETCRLAGFAGVAEVCSELQEWDYGDYEGITTAEIRRSQPGWTLWDDGVPNGETATQVGRRADRVIARLRQTAGDVAVFAHGHMLRVLAARWVALAAQDARVLALDTGTVSVLGNYREQPVILVWNAAKLPNP